jgi:thiamine biosynthesis lipoprotein
MIEGQTMGTIFQVKIVQDDSIRIDKNFLQNEISEILKKVNSRMSTYIEDSEISLFNNYNNTDWYSISEDFAFVLERALEISKQSSGTFDITVGKLVNLWGFGSELKEHTVPDNDQLAALMAITGYQHLEVRLEPPSVKKDIPELYIDLSAIAKGFGVDKIAEYLDSKNVDNYLVEIGGEVRSSGTNQKNEPWKVGIEYPDSPLSIYEVISLGSYSIATSGDYHNYFENNGIRYSHTIDPRTGMPISHKLASVTVVYKSCTLADAYATAINVLGPESGISFALEHKLPAYLIVREEDGFIVKKTPQLDKFLNRENKPD